MKTYGTSMSAPRYSSNSIGTPAWSGKLESDLNLELLSLLKKFILYEGKLQGFNDAGQGRVGENIIFFNSKFLGGWPQRLWFERYNDGVREQKEL